MFYQCKVLLWHITKNNGHWNLQTSNHFWHGFLQLNVISFLFFLKYISLYLSFLRCRCSPFFVLHSWIPPLSFNMQFFHPTPATPSPLVATLILFYVILFNSADTELSGRSITPSCGGQSISVTIRFWPAWICGFYKLANLASWIMTSSAWEASHGGVNCRTWYFLAPLDRISVTIWFWPLR